jgi:hypothetical protein
MTLLAPAAAGHPEFAVSPQGPRAPKTILQRKTVAHNH